jgi:hypothetical protein
MKPVFYKAEWSGWMMLSTVLLTALLLGAAGFTAGAIGGEDAGTRLAMGLTAAVLLATLLLSYLLSPQGYAIDGATLEVVRRLKPVAIPLTGITSAEIGADDLLAGSIKIIGNDGLWGRYGKYRNARLGAYKLYVRRGAPLVLVECGEKYVIAPERPEEFLRELTAAVSHAGGNAG